MKKLTTICAVAAVMIFGTSMAYALPSDNFDNNSIDTTLWTLYEDDHSSAWLDETGGRLEFRSTASAYDLAAYIANDWGFLPTVDFSFKVNFHYDSTASASVFLGIGKDGENDVWLDAGYEESAFFCWEAIVNGSIIDEVEKARGSTDGTLYISYNASEDDLYVSDTGYGSGAAWGTILDLVQGAWDADIVSPFLGGDIWGPGEALPSGAAYLDNFVVDSGTIIPEPATIGLLGLGSLALLRKRRRV